MRKEVLALVGLVLLVDAIFVAAYFLGRMRDASDTAKLVFTAVWTVVTVVVVFRGLMRVRSARLQRGDSKLR